MFAPANTTVVRTLGETSIGTKPRDHADHCAKSYLILAAAHDGSTRYQSRVNSDCWWMARDS